MCSPVAVLRVRVLCELVLCQIHLPKNHQQTDFYYLQLFKRYEFRFLGRLPSPLLFSCFKAVQQILSFWKLAAVSSSLDVGVLGGGCGGFLAAAEFLAAPDVEVLEDWEFLV